MTDTLGTYSWSFHPKHLSKKDLEKIKKIMKTVPIVEARNELHHQKEEQEADQIFEKKIIDLNN